MAIGTKLILASGSPRRRELLAEAGYDFDVVAPSDEVEAAENGLCSNCGPAELVAKLALRKAQDVATRVERGLLVACDTVAECGGQILGKPADIDDARRILELLSGREHRVYSGLCVWKFPERPAELRVAVTRLEMDRLAAADLDEYLASGLWEGKAGAFGYQDRLGWV